MLPGCIPVLALLFALQLEAVPPRRTVLARLEPDGVRGAALGDGPILLTWGRDLAAWNLETGARRLLRREVHLADGCLADVNADGALDLIAQQGEPLGALVALQAPDWTPTVIDQETAFRDCRAATLFGRRGVLVLHRYQQLRFYPFPAQPGAAWETPRDLYSIYTPSRQGGLLPLLADVDEDGRPDLFAGNYWLQAPEHETLHWRLFAVNTYTETPDSALLSLALVSQPDGHFPRLAVTEGGLPRGRLTVFTRPNDPRQIWSEEVLARGLRHARALLAADLDGDHRTDLLVGEGSGSNARLQWWRGTDAGFRAQPLRQGPPVQFLFALPPQQGAARVLAVERGALALWTWPPRRDYSPAGPVRGR